MALINCHKCGKQISDKANLCPHCGYDPNVNLDDFEIEDGVLVKYKGPGSESMTCLQLIGEVPHFLEVVIPNGVTSIGDHAFSCCTVLKSITIPDSVTNIGECAFFGCAGMTSIIIPNSVNSIDNCAFFLCDGLTSITIPDSVTNIGDGAFEGCDNLTIICNEGSHAEEYSIANDIDYKIID